MKTLRFILKKIAVIEVMLLVLFFAKNLFGIEISIINYIIDTGLKYLTPIAGVALIFYIILSFISSRIIETILGMILGGFILYYLIIHGI